MAFSKSSDDCTCRMPTESQCLFPFSADCFPGERSDHNIPIDLDPQVMKHLNHYCTTNNIPEHLVILAAWAALLRYYIGQSSIAFGFDFFDDQAAHNDSKPSPTTTNVISTSLSKDLVILEFLSGLPSFIHKLCSQCVVKKQDSEFNTRVSFYRGQDFLQASLPKSNESFLQLEIYHDRELLQGTLFYNASKVSPEKARDVGFTLSSTILGIVAKPNGRLSELRLHSDAQLQTFLNRLNKTPTAIEGCIQDVVRKHAVKNPKHPAIYAYDGEFTYEGLQRHVSQLAELLKSLGVAPHMLVPILSMKSAWVPVAMLAVMTAGAAFVLMDPSHPAERLEGIIHQVNARVVIHSPNKPDLLLPDVKSFVEISSAAAWLSNKTLASDQKNSIQPYMTAYLIFTSGSTGTPKGVMVQHNQILTSCSAFGNSFGFSKDTRMLQFSAYSFDAVILETLAVLVHGGCIIIPSEEQRVNNLASASRNMHANTALFTPAIARHLSPNDIPTLKTLILGGEALTADVLESWSLHIQVFQAYGPAECSVICTVKEMMLDLHPQHIGNPTGCTAWIVHPDDPKLLLPDGTIGELLIMGPIVAKGYLNDAQKTAESFISRPNWFHEPEFKPPEASSRRIYRTGDLAYFKPDGSLMFVGRKDSQVKLRGQRIELGEIESQLRPLIPNLEDLVVEVIFPGGDKSNEQLAAFVVSKDFSQNGSIDNYLLPFIKKIQTGMLSRLPKYMCPSVYIPLRKVPLTASGKVDRRAIRDQGAKLGLDTIAAYNGFVSTKKLPTTDIEVTLRKLWAQVLKLEETTIYIDDGFFMLGGNSLKAIRLVSVVREAGLSLTFSQVFRHPTLADMAGHVNVSVEGRTEVRPWELIPYSQHREVLDKTREQCSMDVIVEDVYPSTPEQDRMLRESLLSLEANVLNKVYELGPEIDIDKFRNAFQSVVEAYPILRTRLVDLDGGSSVQVVVKESIIQKQAITISEDRIELREKLTPGFGTKLSRYSIIKNCTLSKDTYYFAWSIHHSLFDGWSMDAIWKTLISAYFHDTIPHSTPFTHLLKYTTNTDSFANNSFWKSYMCGARSTTLLKKPHETYIPRQTSRFSTRLNVPRPLDANITMTTIIQTAFAMALSRKENSNSITFRTTGTGRNLPIPGIDTIVAPTLTSFPVNITLPSTPTSLKAFLTTLQARQVAATQHEFLGVKAIAALLPEGNAIISFDSPYLIVQIDTENMTRFPGLVEVEQELAFSRTPLSVCCVVKEWGVKVIVAWDERVIGEGEVRELVKEFGNVLERVLGSLRGGGEALVADVMG